MHALSMACKYDLASQKLDTGTLLQSGSSVYCCETASFVSSTGSHLYANTPHIYLHTCHHKVPHLTEHCLNYS